MNTATPKPCLSDGVFIKVVEIQSLYSKCSDCEGQSIRFTFLTSSSSLFCARVILEEPITVIGQRNALLIRSDAAYIQHMQSTFISSARVCSLLYTLCTFAHCSVPSLNFWTRAQNCLNTTTHFSLSLHMLRTIWLLYLAWRKQEKCQIKAFANSV